MSNVYTLADIRESLEKKYAPLSIDLGKGKVVLRNAMRLGKEERKEVQALISSAKTEENTEDAVEELLDNVKAVIRLVADSEKGAETLIEEIGDDLAFALEIVNLWNGATRPAH
jgi:endonuclease III